MEELPPGEDPEQWEKRQRQWTGGSGSFQRLSPVKGAPEPTFLWWNPAWDAETLPPQSPRDRLHEPLPASPVKQPRPQ
jgi:hypothetical protein